MSTNYRGRDESPRQTENRRASRVITLVLVLAWVLVPARLASAHAIILSTDPAGDETISRSTDKVVMRFNEPVEVSFGAIRVYDTTGDRVDAGDAEHAAGQADVVEVPLESDLPDGTYTVTWHVVSADGHPITEAFVFHVGSPGERPEGIADEILATQSGSGRIVGVLYGVTRWINFAALLMLAGGAIFLAVVWRRRSALPMPDAVEHSFLRRWRSILIGSWVAALGATLAAFVLQGAVAGDLALGDAVAPSVLSEVADTRFGVVSLVKLALLAAIATQLFASRRRLLHPARVQSVGAAGAVEPVGATSLVIGGVLVAGLLATPGLAGHAGTTDPVWLNVPADVLHLAAGAAWVGGLVVLLGAAFPAVTGLSDRESGRALAPVVTRFSDMAMVAVTVLVVTGLYRAWTEIGALRALTGATYGWVLIAKVAAFVPLVALGAINNRWAKPRIQRAVADDDSPKEPLQRLRRVVGGEIALAIVVLALTALLVNLPPARVAAGVTGPFIKDIRAGDYRVNVLVDPNEVGENEVHVTATTGSGAPAPIKATRVLFRMPSEDIGPLIGRGRRLAEGHFVVQGHQLSVAGEWQLEIVMRSSRFDEDRATVGVTVND